MKEYATTSQAVKITGKSESTIKRMVRDIAADDSHADRGLIYPSPEELRKLKASNKPYRWKISLDLLQSRFEPVREKKFSNEKVEGHSALQIIDLLQEQLRSKDSQLSALEKQLDRKDEQIATMSHLMKDNSARLQESNILMKHLQDRLGIATPVDSDVVETGTAEMLKSTKTTDKNIKPRFFDRIFRRNQATATSPLD